ncbi:hypothetical protein F5884DRAFT_680314 [Xylogone sp. PMI_703]|nr:hypothetical protein F5884DRAFT_680314 [Xylogone sp. PMI_703]
MKYQLISAHSSPGSPGNGSSSTRNRPLSHGRRRSAVLMNLQLNDPTLPPPGEMITEGQSSYRTASPLSISGSPIQTTGDPHHNRTPSLGEIHQELEQEQEAQVNRLLQMIRTQQQHLQQLQAAAGQPQSTSSPIFDENTPPAERSPSLSNQPVPVIPTTSTPRSPGTGFHPRSSFDMTRADIQRRSRTPSRTASPRMRSTSISGEGGDSWSLSGRDESAFYQAETQMMARENQMLRQRIRELERQVSELNANAASNPHEPVTPSHLLRSTSVSDEPTPSSSAITTSESTLEESKEEQILTPAPV